MGNGVAPRKGFAAVTGDYIGVHDAFGWVEHGPRPAVLILPAGIVASLHLLADDLRFLLSARTDVFAGLAWILALIACASLVFIAFGPHPNRVTGGSACGSE
jgi:hypothetical protein